MDVTKLVTRTGNEFISKLLPLPVIAVTFHIFDCWQLNLTQRRGAQLDPNINFCHSVFLCSVIHGWMQKEYEFVARPDLQISLHNPCAYEVWLCVCPFQVYKFRCWTAFWQGKQVDVYLSPQAMLRVSVCNPVYFRLELWQGLSRLMNTWTAT